MEVQLFAEYCDGKIILKLEDWQYQDIKSGVARLYSVRNASLKSTRGKRGGTQDNILTSNPITSPKIKPRIIFVDPVTASQIDHLRITHQLKDINSATNDLVTFTNSSPSQTNITRQQPVIPMLNLTLIGQQAASTVPIVLPTKPPSPPNKNIQLSVQPTAPKLPVIK